MQLIIAHRGASAYAHENSLEAFRLAVRQGANGVELDVHATADGKLIVFHDTDLGGKPIAGLPAEPVLAHRLPNGETIPTLEDALEVLEGQTEAFIEVKTLPPSRDETIFATIDASPAPDRCHVHSFDHRIIRRLGAQRPDLSMGVLSSSYPIDPVGPVLAAGARVLWQQVEMVDRALLDRAHAAGISVYAWTVDDPDRMRTLIEWRVDGICTNMPDIAWRVVG